jgi:hypothetical protein
MEEWAWWKGEGELEVRGPVAFFLGIFGASMAGPYRGESEPKRFGVSSSREDVT